MRLKILLLAVSIVLSCLSMSYAEEKITLSTFYPAPYGDYDELTVTSLGVDDPSTSGVGQVFTTTNPGELIVEGSVGIGTTSPTAKLHVNGDIKAVLPNIVGNPMVYNPGLNTIGYDIAELFNTTEEVEVGDVLVIDETEDIKLHRSRTPYEKGVAGIVSGSPAILFEGSQLEIAPAPGGFTNGKKPPVALIGRVPCKVSIENGSIKRGDLLATSSTPGHAMKATDREKSFGAIVGKALESFSGGTEGEATGKIIVLVTLQ